MTTSHRGSCGGRASLAVGLCVALASAACSSGSGGGKQDDPTPTRCTAAGVPGICVETSACGGASTGTAGSCAGTEVCCTPAVAVSCDPAARPLPNTGLVEAPGAGGCPAGMVAVGTFCIDRFEASLVDVVSGASLSPYWNPGSAEVRAVSIAGAVPQAYVSGTQAAAACANAAKRLCTDAEWLEACRGGAAGNTWPYGAARVEGACNDLRAQHPAVTLFGTTDAWIWSYLSHPCLDQIPGSLAAAGSFAACATADGVMDLAGNLDEWTADPAGTLRGGDFTMGSLNGEGCNSATTAHAAGFSDFATGFRCCADP